MMCKFSLYILFFISSTIYAYSQQEIGNVRLRVIYKYAYKTAINQPEYVKSDLFYLDVGEKVTIFYSRNKQIKDSIRLDASRKGATVDEIRSSTIGLSDGLSSIFCDFLDKNKRQESKKWGYFYAYYDEDKLLPTWNIESKFKEIIGYKCQRATTTFLGRTWVVYFAPEIPVNSGPWKLWGLPGLILEASDIDGFFLFESVGLYRFSDKSPIIINPIWGKRKYKKVEQKEFKKMDKLYHEQPLNFMQSVLRLSIQHSESSNKNPSIPYIPLEPW